MTSRLIEKRDKGLSKLCSCIRLAPTVFDVRFTEHINFNESIALDFRLENMKSATESAKCLMQKVYGVDSMDVIDLPARLEELLQL